MLMTDTPPVITDDVIARLQVSAARFAETADVADGLCASKILIVDDEPINVKLVRKYLKMQGYHNFITTSESPQVLELVERERPDLLLLDVMMPVMSGLDVLRELRAVPGGRYLPVIVLTALNDRSVRLEALELGAADFLSKPLDVAELMPRVRNVLMAKAYQNRLAGHSAELEAAVGERTRQLERARLEVVHCLARAAEFRDDDTGRHVARVGKYAGIIARKLDQPAAWCALLELAAQLHDIGKLGVSDAVLLKPGKLDAGEWELMRRHCLLGQKVLSPIDEDLSGGHSPLIGMARSIAMTHHEKWDGTGYPQGLAGLQIPLEGRITAVADVFDALTNQRAYKPAFSLEQSFEILADGRGRHFDPQVLDGFFSDREAIVRTRLEFADPE
jgi:cyclic di-GMP phosphodiesterase